MQELGVLVLVEIPNIAMHWGLELLTGGSGTGTAGHHRVISLGPRPDCLLLRRLVSLGLSCQDVSRRLQLRSKLLLKLVSYLSQSLDRGYAALKRGFGFD